MEPLHRSALGTRNTSAFKGQSLVRETAKHRATEYVPSGEKPANKEQGRIQPYPNGGQERQNFRQFPTKFPTIDWKTIDKLFEEQ